MCAEHSEAAIEAFRRVKVAFDTYVSERMRLHATVRAELPALVEAAMEDSHDAALAFELLPGLTAEERQGLLRHFVELCASGRYAGRAKAAILDLPNDWLRDNVETAAQRLLAGSDYLDWANLLEVVSRIDPAVERRIAERAAGHSDSEIRELGEEHLRRLTGGSGPA
ncbi:MAG TPA: hypothetical protein VN380_15230 [Thermoanaerobaculia bacterium]|jgi:hypothetical protein|nr:hypothetical protein [Thermoanaerobaculia bacterium]